MSSVNHKRGDTFSFSAAFAVDGVPVEGLANKLKCQVRTRKDVLISEMTITESATPGTYIFTVADTADWPIGELYYDIQMTDDAGIITSSETVTINVIKDVTHE